MHEQSALPACLLDKPAGTMMPIGSTHVMAFYEHPRLIRLADGEVELSFPWIASGVQLGSIMHNRALLPPVALDPEHRRFAVVQGDRTHIVSIALSGTT